MRDYQMPSLPRKRDALLGLLALPAALAQTLREPTADQVLNSFSGSGSIPFDYSPSSDAVSSINIAALLADPNGGNQTFVIANGLLPSSGDYTAVFAPSGLCGALSKSVHTSTQRPEGPLPGMCSSNVRLSQPSRSSRTPAATAPWRSSGTSPSRARPSSLLSLLHSTRGRAASSKDRLREGHLAP